MTIIGLSCGMDYKENCFQLRASYQQVLEKYGASVVLLPPQKTIFAKEIIATIDGLIFTGGGDIAPLYWQEEPQKGLGAVDPKRDNWEVALLKYALRASLPILAICRGMQLVNIAMGGSVWQDLYCAEKNYLQHMQNAPGWHSSHTVTVIHPQLQKIINKKEMQVNSFHHQGIKCLAKNLEAAAYSKDGLLEAWVAPQYDFCIGVQWHPELTAENDASSKAIFASFIREANKRTC